jgi:hypothetical protein
MFEPASYQATETLTDGGRVKIRAQRLEDRTALLEAVDRASAETLYHRFLAAKRQISQEEERTFLDIDFVNHVVLVAETTAPTAPVDEHWHKQNRLDPKRQKRGFSRPIRHVPRKGA